ncbi:hypothetical protein A2856_01725 [Candidatus Uhrbacteria bacterium RIFCSPHIGHO2_01_FULL_63_20]|uniref:Uncharacterized protein n=1 Tax=Candidatus Uhrbacteria bacterium RIFCSPHIGHO2_01_FULL_63_20 TaxID=1802385 RepID=A0A1F7TK50_9BACT|nr:MAG: hypothetical protein A2856_01725 [Candidatus Uhrbacteria bacterium RIFCSPHIGHO2_01_FULL_63_20]
MTHVFFSFRSLLWWLGLFPTLYIASVMLYVTTVATGNPSYLYLAQLAGPGLFLLFGWLYFRKLEIQTFEFHFATGLMWVVLTLAGYALLMRPIYGVSWLSVFGVGTLVGQAANLAAVLIAGHIAKKHPNRSLPGNP